MPVELIPELFDDAHALEHSREQLHQWLAPQLPVLAQYLHLPERNALGALVGFLMAYIEAVPVILGLAAQAARDRGTRELVDPIIRHANRFFEISDDTAARRGIHRLLESAFLALRLAEELNDHHRRLRQQPLLPLDLTEANLIVHHVLGDQRAGRLEDLVTTTTGLELLHAQEQPPLPGGDRGSVPAPELPLTQAARDVRLRIAI
jgi:hypothetical protein